MIPCSASAQDDGPVPADTAVDQETEAVEGEANEEAQPEDEVAEPGTGEGEEADEAFEEFPVDGTLGVTGECKRYCKGDFTVGIGVGYTHFPAKKPDSDYVGVADKGNGQMGVLFAAPDIGNAGGGYGLTVTGHFGYTVANNWLIGAAVNYAYKPKIVQAEALARYYIKLDQPNTIPFLCVRVGYLWAMGKHKEPNLRADPLPYEQDGETLNTGNPLFIGNQVPVDMNGDVIDGETWVEKSNSNGYYGGVELGVSHFFSDSVGLFVTLGYQYIFTGYHKGGGVDLKAGVSFGF